VSAILLPSAIDRVKSDFQKAPLDNKIQILALKQMPSSLELSEQKLASVFKMLSSSLIQEALKESRRWQIKQEREPLAFRRSLVSSKLPIGLQSNHYAFWLNALMQFVIFVPTLRALFDYTPKSFLYFNLFIDQYLKEQKEELLFCSFDSMLLLDALASYFQKSFYFHREVFDLFGLLIQIKKSAGFFKKELLEIEIDRENLEEKLRDNLPFLPSEILATQKYPFLLKDKALLSEPNSQNSQTKRVKTQFFFKHCFYELDAFIEYREDIIKGGSYLAYLKDGGIWYQCDDLRIVPMRSKHLQMAINRSLLLHYKKIEFGFSRKRV